MPEHNAAGYGSSEWVGPYIPDMDFGIPFEIPTETDLTKGHHRITNSSER